MHRAATTLALLAALYSLTGFFIVPVAINNLAPFILPAESGWALRLGNTSFNPYTLTLNLDNLTLAPRPGMGLDPDQPLLTIARLRLELDPASLSERAWLGRELTVSGLFMHLIRPPGPGQNQAGLWAWLRRFDRQHAYALRNITIRDSELIFTDRGHGIYQRAEKIYLALPLLSNRAASGSRPAPGRLAQPAFSAIVNGRPLALSAAPRATGQSTAYRFDLDLQEIDLPTLLDSMSIFPNLEIAQGRLDLNLTIFFPLTFTADSGIEIRSEGEVRDLQAHDVHGCGAAVGHGSFRLGFMPRTDAYQLEELVLDDLNLDCPGNWQLAAGTLRTAAASRQPGQLDLGRISGTGVRINLATELLSRPPPARRGDRAVTVRSLDLGAAELAISRGAAPEEAALRFSQVEIHGANLTGSADSTGAMTITAAMADRGRIDCQGQVTVFPLTARLRYQAANLPFAPFRPLLGSFIQPTMTATRLDGGGELVWPALAISGSATVTDFSNNISPPRDFFACPTTTLSDFRLTLAPPALTIAALDFIKPQFAMTRTARKEPALAAFLPPAALGQAPADQPRIAIAAFRLTDGTVTLTDHTAMPAAELRIAGFNSELLGIVNQPGPATPFSLRGAMTLIPDSDDYPLANSGPPARLTVTGQAALFGASSELQAVLTINDFNLPSFGPYLVPLLGYQADRGRLDLAADINLRNRQLTSRNRFLVRDLKLGTSSSGRFNTPLTVALLTDPDRNIRLDLEASGDLSQPAFSYPAALAARIRKILAGTTSTPFALLAEPGKQPESLDYLVFPPGSTELDQQPAGRLARLTAILEAHPLLRLSIAGRVDPRHDLPTNNRTATGPATPQRLQALARRRGEAIREALTLAGIAADRLHLEEPTATPDEDILLDRPPARADITPRP
jgi:hypothetical protein